ncbi:MAG: rubrerythrin family protein [Clostridiales bacterium]|nr:rubrerythrin family protein [Clostridiales bacterium]
MADLKGTKTEKNLQEAFAGESQARNKYTYFSSVAKKEGYVQIANFFAETAENEKEHAKLWFKELAGIGDTKANLVAAATGEKGEWTEMYPRMAKEAREEGFKRIAALFEGVSKIEKEHEARYNKLRLNIEDNTTFAKPEKVYWKCLNCGHIHYGERALEVCPVCAHPKAYFEVLGKNY